MFSQTSLQSSRSLDVLSLEASPHHRSCSISWQLYSSQSLKHVGNGEVLVAGRQHCGDGGRLHLAAAIGELVQVLQSHRRVSSFQEATDRQIGSRHIFITLQLAQDALDLVHFTVSGKLSQNQLAKFQCGGQASLCSLVCFQHLQEVLCHLGAADLQNAGDQGVHCARSHQGKLEQVLHHVPQPVRIQDRHRFHHSFQGCHFKASRDTASAALCGPFVPF
mmetsp:Transcript_76344/g.168643  ORF Transcript_76344/g.168643 Transcript_76344/m.168643 type:complete len:220 (+) Transcript_76344:2212-2871(+)